MPCNGWSQSLPNNCISASISVVLADCHLVPSCWIQRSLWRKFRWETVLCDSGIYGQYFICCLLFLSCANKWSREWHCLTGGNPCLSVRCESGEECDINKFGIARCECPPQCEPVMRPVCGQDGRTYESLCEMRRSSCMQKKLIDVKHTGSCGKTTTVEMWPTTPCYYKSSFCSRRSMIDWLVQRM